MGAPFSLDILQAGVVRGLKYSDVQRDRPSD